jgi:predicted dehydrogenase
MRIGIVGLGYWGKKVFREYYDLMKEGVVDSIHLYDAKIELLSQENFRDKSVIVHYSYKSLIDSVDAVHICVPNDFHYEYTSKALLAGINTLVEKPLTKNSTEAFNLVEIALEKGVVLQVGNIFRFANSIRAARDMIFNGDIGDVHHVYISWTHMATSENSKTEDVLWDLGPHIFDILNFLTGLWPVSVIYSPYGGRSENKLSEADIIVNYTNFNANIRISLVNHMRTRLVEIVGIKATLNLDPVNQKLEVHSNGNVECIEIERNNTLRDEILNFIECSINGRTKVNSGNLGTAIVRELENIYGASRSESFTRIQ